MAVIFERVAGTGNAVIVLLKREAGVKSWPAFSSAFAMASGDRVRCVISPGAPGPQTLTVYVNGTSRLSTGTIDDSWSAGYVGLGVISSTTGDMSFDNFKVGYDNNTDGDIDDAGDDIQIDDSFASNVVSLVYDNNGNLTDDGILLYTYDAWNRLVKATRRLDAKNTVSTYAYDGMNRRTKKVVSNSGIEVRKGDGGETTVHFYYDSEWRIIETRNGSNQTTRQWVMGTQYTDEIIFMDVNGDPSIGNDCNPDVSASGENVESPADHRYFYQQDRNWNVVALTDYGGGVNGNIVERYLYTPYGEAVVLKGVGSGSNELACPSLTSLVGNPFMHQGLPLDEEKGSYQNRRREYDARLARFGQRDPIRLAAGYLAYSSNPTSRGDPSGEMCTRTQTTLGPPGPIVTIVPAASGVYCYGCGEGFETREALWILSGSASHVLQKIDATAYWTTCSGMFGVNMFCYYELVLPDPISYGTFQIDFNSMNNRNFGNDGRSAGGFYYDAFTWRIPTTGFDDFTMIQFRYQGTINIDDPCHMFSGGWPCMNCMEFDIAFGADLDLELRAHVQRRYQDNWNCCRLVGPPPGTQPTSAPG